MWITEYLPLPNLRTLHSVMYIITRFWPPCLNCKHSQSCLPSTTPPSSHPTLQDERSLLSGELLKSVYWHYYIGDSEPVSLTVSSLVIERMFNFYSVF